MANARRVVRGSRNGDTHTEDAYLPPVLANPGNAVQQTYSAEEVAAILARHGIDDSDLRHMIVGGGVMGDKLCHENEAPYPEALAAFFVKSFCPPGGLVADPMLGSGTTAKVALQLGRRFVGCDVRSSQVAIARRRVEDLEAAP